jgi:hypothetical protein
MAIEKADLAQPEDLYKKYKMLQKQLEFLDTQEDYLKDEIKVRSGVGGVGPGGGGRACKLLVISTKPRPYNYKIQIVLLVSTSCSGCCGVVRLEPLWPHFPQCPLPRPLMSSEPEARANPGQGRNHADPVGAVGDWAVFRDDRRELRHRGLHRGLVLLRCADF